MSSKRAPRVGRMLVVGVLVLAAGGVAGCDHHAVTVSKCVTFVHRNSDGLPKIALTGSELKVVEKCKSP